MKLDIDITGDLAQLTAAFRQSPKKVQQATARALRKLTRFAERQVLRTLAREQNLTQSLLKKLGRVRVSLKSSEEGYRLIVWVGLQDIPAHYLGKVSATPWGVRTGKHRWEGAFLMQPANAAHPMVFKRKAHWVHKLQRSTTSGRILWIGLPIAKQRLPIYDAAHRAITQLEPKLLDRFATLMQQELNYAFHVQS